MGLEQRIAEMKKNESDGAYKYSKQLFQDPKLAAIHSNIEYIISNMGTFDIDIYTILRTIYPNQNNFEYISGLVFDRDNFFRLYLFIIVFCFVDFSFAFH